MTQQNPSPRKAVVAFGVPMNQTIINALGGVLASGGTPWDAEDAVYAFRDHAVADRPTWLALETALAGRADPEAALVLAESLANGATEGQPPNPSQGTEADVIALFEAHALTANSRKARVRALSRVVANREQPSAVLAALVAAVGSLAAA